MEQRDQERDQPQDQQPNATTQHDRVCLVCLTPFAPGGDHDQLCQRHYRRVLALSARKLLQLAAFEVDIRKQIAELEEELRTAAIARLYPF